jgi:hypothetical protein
MYQFTSFTRSKAIRSFGPKRIAQDAGRGYLWLNIKIDLAVENADLLNLPRRILQKKEDEINLPEFNQFPLTRFMF